MGGRGKGRGATVKVFLMIGCKSEQAMARNGLTWSFSLGRSCMGGSSLRGLRLLRS